MTEMARNRRWKRFIDPQSEKALIVPLDHGLTMGPIRGINRPEEMLSWVNTEAVTGVVLHKGIAERIGGQLNCGLIIHLNGSINTDEQPDLKQLVTTVEAAVRLGADAVSVQTNFSAITASHNLRLVGHVVDEAHAWGMPVLNMVYDKSINGSENLASIRHFMRAAVELGVDALKVAAPKDFQQIPEMLDGIQSHTPVLFAGGTLANERALIELAAATVEHNAGGICVGRNVFQRTNPTATLTQLQSVFRDDMLSETGFARSLTMRQREPELAL
ncbi:class I fructose-bisphosphate aldolase [Microbulbifer epialgicus]|uniref:Class I fructose-bisphosphate aldolase n=1 Tax=Microbulbifer epialgicus TaxID=393907 RepID=A0ABV4NZ59_9GAMM